MSSKTIKKRLRKLNNICIVVTIISYIASRISPVTFPIAAFFAMSIPIWLVVNLGFVLYWTAQRYTYAVLSLITLGIGYPSIKKTVGINFDEMPRSQGLIKVLSYNVHVFNSYRHLKNENWESSKAMIKFVTDNDAPIKCLQEVFDDERSEHFNVVNQMLVKGYQYYLTPTSKSFIKAKGGYFGLAIFSKYPIIHQGELKLSKNRGNRAIFVDVVVKNDTLRVYNVHLQSMSIDEGAILSPGYKEAKKTYFELLRTLKRSFAKRTQQIQMLEEHFMQCHYPILICGDLNEMPYGYTYRSLRDRFENGFENAGHGFGFTYNGKIPFLRIDNQFYDPRLEIQYFNTLRKVGNSDHFPTLGIYKMKKGAN